MTMTGWLVMSAALASAAGCGWLGIDLETPEIVVAGADVSLREPLRLATVAERSPAADAGLRAGMSLESIDGEAWDGPGFLAGLVRLQTVGAGESVRLGLDGGRPVVVEAVACDDEQARQRARLLANLGRMEGSAWSRFHGHPAAYLAGIGDAERTALDEARREYMRAIRQIQTRLDDPEITERIAQAMRDARQAGTSPEVADEVSRAQRRLQEAFRAARSESRSDAEASLAQARRAYADALRSAGRGSALAGADSSSGEALQSALARVRQGASRENGDAIRALREAVALATEGPVDAGQAEVRRLQRAAMQALEAARLGPDARRLALLAAAGQVEGVRQAAEAIGPVRFRLHRGLPGGGLEVEQIDEDTPLGRLGVRRGDVLLRAGGHELIGPDTLLDVLRERAVALADEGSLSGTLPIEVQGESGRRTIELPVDAADSRDPI